jgi:hypothetical protein
MRPKYAQIRAYFFQASFTLRPTTVSGARTVSHVLASTQLVLVQMETATGSLNGTLNHLRVAQRLIHAVKRTAVLYLETHQRTKPSMPSLQSFLLVVLAFDLSSIFTVMVSLCSHHTDTRAIRFLTHCLVCWKSLEELPKQSRLQANEAVSMNLVLVVKSFTSLLETLEIIIMRYMAPIIHGRWN